MSIRIKCDQCGKIAEVPDEHAGKRARCVCGATITIPEAPPAQQAAQGSPADPRAASGAGTQKARRSAQRPRRRPAGARRRPPRKRSIKPAAGRWQAPVVVVGGLVLAGLVVAIVVLSSGGPASLDAVADDPFKAVPAGAKAIGCLRLKDLGRAGFIQTVISASKDVRLNPTDSDAAPVDIAGLLRSANLDPGRDLDLAVIAVTDQAGNAAAIVTGRFDKLAIRQTIKDKHPRKTSYRGYQLAQLTPGSHLALINTRIIVVGSLASVREVIDVLKARAQPMEESSPLRQKGSELSNQTFWLTGDISPARLPGAPRGEEAEAAPKLKNTAVYGTMRFDTIDFTVELTCEDAKAAEMLTGEMKKGVGELKAMAAMLTAGDAEADKLVGDLVRSIEIGSREDQATVSFRISQSFIQKAGALAAKIAPPTVVAQGTRQGSTPQPDVEPPKPVEDNEPEEPELRVEELDAPAVLGATHRHILPAYDSHMEKDRLIAALDLAILDNVYFTPGDPEQTDGLDPEKVFMRVRQGHIYLTKEGKLMPIGRTKMAPLELPRAKTVEAKTFAGRLGQMTMRQVIDQLDSYLEANKPPKGRSFDAARDKTYVASVPGGRFVAIEVLSKGPDTSALMLVPIGSLSACQSHLAEIVMACDQFAADKGDASYPRTLQQLVRDHFIDRSVLACPSDAGAKAKKRNSYECALDVANKQIRAGDVPDNMIFVWDGEPRHGGRRCVAFADGTVRTISEQAFQSRLKMLKAYLAKPPGEK